VLDLAPTTAAARWRRLEQAGVAWIAVHPNPVSRDYVTAIVELTCIPRKRAALAERLVLDGRIVSVEESSRGSDLVLTVMVATLDELTGLVLVELSEAPGVQTVRSSVVVHAHHTGGDWRAGALDGDQVAALRRARDQGLEEHAAARERVPEGAWSIVAALASAPRLSVAELARSLDRNPATVRRHLGAVLSGERLAFRCDVAHDIVGLPVTATYIVRVPQAELPRVVAALRHTPELRMCLQVTGEANLIFSVLGRSVAAVGAFGDALGRRLPQVQVLESLLILRAVKGWGGSSGRTVGAPASSSCPRSCAAPSAAEACPGPPAASGATCRAGICPLGRAYARAESGCLPAALPASTCSAGKCPLWRASAGAETGGFPVLPRASICRSGRCPLGRANARAGCRSALGTGSAPARRAWVRRGCAVSRRARARAARRCAGP